MRLRSFEFWFYGLASTFIGGAATAVIAKTVLPNTIVDFEDFWKLALSAGLINACFYLKKSPLPQITNEEPTIAAPTDPVH